MSNICYLNKGEVGNNRYYKVTNFLSQEFGDACGNSNVVSGQETNPDMIKCLDNLQTYCSTQLDRSS